MSESSINTLIGTFSSISTITNYSIVSDALICIDTSSNRIGINTLDPSYSIHIVDTPNYIDASINIGIYTPRLFLDIDKIARSIDETNKKGQVYVDSLGYLKVRMTLP